MAIFEEDLKYLSKKANDPYFKESFAFYKNCIDIAIKRLKKEFPFFSESDVQIYIQGSYQNGTMVDELAKLEIVVEFGQNSFATLEKLPKLKISRIWSDEEDGILVKKRVVSFKPNVHLGIIKKILLESLMAQTGNDGIYNNSKSIYIPAYKSNKIPCEILPCYTLNNTPGNESVIIYDAYINKYVAAFPKLHCKNLATKNEETEGNFIQVVRIFRNIRDILIKNEVIKDSFAPSYFLECLLYNIPNELYKGGLSSMILKILNYLINCNLNDFICAHEQFKMFGNNSDAWTTYKARSFINLLSNVWEQYENE